MAAHIQRKQRSATGIESSDENGRGKGGKGSQAHRKDAGVLGKTGEGPKLPDFAGVQGGRRGLAGRCSCPWLNSLNGDDVDNDADLQDALAWRLVHCNGGASSTKARWSSASFLASELAEKI
jgi:hypothetical protein